MFPTNIVCKPLTSNQRMNNTMRIAMECHPLNLWFEDSPNGTGVSWHGRTAWQFADLKFRIGILLCRNSFQS